jgi:hypothetical protein
MPPKNQEMLRPQLTRRRLSDHYLWLRGDICLHVAAATDISLFRFGIAFFVKVCLLDRVSPSQLGTDDCCCQMNFSYAIHAIWKAFLTSNAPRGSTPRSITSFAAWLPRRSRRRLLHPINDLCRSKGDLMICKRNSMTLVVGLEILSRFFTS